MISKDLWKIPTATTVFRGWLWQWPQVSSSTPKPHCKTPKHLSKAASRRILRAAFAKPSPAWAAAARRRGGGGAAAAAAGGGKKKSKAASKKGAAALEEPCELESDQPGRRPGGRGSGPSDVGARPALLAAHGAPPSRRRGLALPQEQAPALRADAARAAGAAGGGRGRVRFFYMYHYPPTGRPDSHF